MNPSRRIRRLRRFAKLAGLALTLAAISQEMAKPEPERTWHGKVIGFVPYDFRPPTWERIRRAYWNPEDPRLFTDKVLGVGWSINLNRASQLLEQGFRTMMGTTPPDRLARRKTA
jgi:ABC-type sugar transport system substrate-binding protein